MALKNVCRLCSTKEQIFDVFHPRLDNGERLRFSILLATGIEIKESDLISKMVCHRCCAVALKLRQYRTNSVANDKLLQEQSKQPYKPPIVDQQELLLAATKIFGANKSLYDSLGLLNVVKKESVDKPSIDPNDTNTFLTNLFTTEAKNKTHLDTDDTIMTTDQDRPSKLPEVSSMQYKNVPEIEWKHPSVRKLLDTYTNVDVPKKVFKSDLSPVITLDSTEVSDWYAEKLRTIEHKLPNINIKRVGTPIPSASSNTVFSTDSGFSMPSTSKTVDSIGMVSSIPLTSTNTVSSTEVTSPTLPPSTKTASFPTPSAPTKIVSARSVLSTDGESSISPVTTTTMETTPSVSSTYLLSPIPTVSLVLSTSTKTVSPIPSASITESSIPSASITESSIPLASTDAISLCSTGVASSTFSPSTKSVSPSSSTETESSSSASSTPGESQSHSTSTTITDSSSISPASSKYCPATAVPQNDKISSCNNQRQKPCPRKYKMKRNYMRIVDSSDSDDDHKSEKAVSPRKEKKNSKVCLVSELSSTSQQEPIVSINVLSSDEEAKTSNGFQIRRKRRFSEEDTKHEIIPRKIEKVSFKTSLLSTRKSPPVASSHVQLDLPDILLCRSCNKFYDTEEELLNHENTHLKCKFCKKKMHNAEFLHIHQNETCPINIINNQPTVELTKVDTISSIVKKYSKAFQKPETEKQISPDINYGSTNDEYIDYSELGLNIEKPPNELFIELEESIANEYFTLLEDLEKHTEEVSIKEVHKNPEVVCLSDEENSSPVTSSSKQPNNIPISSQNNLTEKEVINALFKKYYSNSSIKKENTTQTLIGQGKKISVVKTNSSIVIHNIINALIGYKLLVELKSDPCINAEFKNVPAPETPTLTYNWTYTKPIDLQKNQTLKQLIVSPPNVSIPAQNPPYASNMLRQPLHNISYTGPIMPPQPPPPSQKLNNMFTTALPYPYPVHKVLPPRQQEFKHSVAPPTPSTSYGMPSAPLNKIVTVENNQDNVLYEQPDQLFYNNQNVNVNNYFMFPQDQTSTITSGTSCINNTYSIPPPSYQQHLQNFGYETPKQNMNILPSPNNIQQNSTNTIRVRKIHELS